MEDNDTYFEEYTHSKAIIYSSLNHQYEYELVECGDHCKILCTKFDFNYISGLIPYDYKIILKKIKKYIIKHKKNEFILFAPSLEWDNVLIKTFNEIQGVIDHRSIFELDIKKFNRIYDEYSFKYQVDIIEEQENNSKFKYKIAVIKDDNHIVAYCKGFMNGKSNVEIDVFVEENYRRKGMAFEVSLKMIKYLIDNNMIPNWTCWSKKNSSRMLAQKLGFNHVMEINAYIWVDEFSKIV